jgi:hypothetical protein
MSVQDDKREKLMLSLLDLQAGGSRSGVDAYLIKQTEDRKIEIPLELKSTTNNTVSTARDVGMAHIEKWRQRVWVFGFFANQGEKLHSVICLKPSELESWFSKVESYIKPDFSIGELSSKRLQTEDLHIICGKKEIYTLNDAESLHKKQWTKHEYISHMDLADGYSPQKMLEILRLRAKYLNERGSTLNNPHIPEKVFRDRTVFQVKDGNYIHNEDILKIHNIISEGWSEINILKQKNSDS